MKDLDMLKIMSTAMSKTLGSDTQLKAFETGKRKSKGQLRAAKPKASGAAQLKRAAKKRNNIRKHS